MAVNQEIVKAIRTIVQEEIAKAGFDKTRAGLIVGVNIDGTYSVKVDERVYPNIPNISHAKYSVGMPVKVTYPCGNISQMYITGGLKEYIESTEPETPIIYNVGDIYITTNNVNPSTIFGGEWEQIQGRFLLGADSSYTAGTTGGSSNITIPEHSHEINNTTLSHTHNLDNLNLSVDQAWIIQSINAGVYNLASGSTTVYGLDAPQISSGQQNTVGSYHTHTLSGGSSATVSEVSQIHKHTMSSSGSVPNSYMPPYLVVYIWKRVA